MKTGFVSAVSAALSGGDKITLVGFGTFSVTARSQREGRNPRTGEKIDIPASKLVKFKAGRTLSGKVKQQNVIPLILNKMSEGTVRRDEWESSPFHFFCYDSATAPNARNARPPVKSDLS